MILHSLATAFFATFYLWAATFGAFVLAVFLCRASAEDHDYPPRNPGDDLAEYRDVSRLDALDADRLRVCGHSNGRLSCDRAALHDGPHGDRHSMPGDRPVLWIDGELGTRSLDEIRRDADEWGGPDAA